MEIIVRYSFEKWIKENKTIKNTQLEYKETVRFWKIKICITFG